MDDVEAVEVAAHQILVLVFADREKPSGGIPLCAGADDGREELTYARRPGYGILVFLKNPLAGVFVLERDPARVEKDREHVPRALDGNLRAVVP